MEESSRERHVLLIVTYNRKELLKECIHAACHQTIPYERIVVIDNASTDGTQEYLRALEGDGRLQVIRESENLGGAGGFAHGLTAAHALSPDWITIIDDDAILRPDFLEQIEAAIQKYGTQYECFAGVPLTQGIRPGHRRRVMGGLIKKEQAVPREEYDLESFSCDIGSFCGLVIADHLIEKIGVPRKEYFIWYDDTEYCLRISRYTKILNWNKAVIDHKAPMEQGSNYAAGWKEYYGIRNRIDMSRKHYGRPTTIYIIFKKRMKSILLQMRLCARGHFAAAAQTRRLYHTAIRDGKKGVLGLHRIYRPGYHPPE